MQTVMYLWINEKEQFETKSYEYSFIPTNVQYVYKWELPNNRFLVPTYLCDNPFNHGHLLAFCDLYHTAGDAFMLDENNLKKSLLQFIGHDENCEVVQGHDLNLHKTIYDEHARLCYLADINIIPCEDSYRFSTFNKIYEKIWITRYILHTICSLHSVCVNFTDLTYHPNGTPVDANSSMNNEESLDNMLNSMCI
jgi:hypothetical protein